MLSFDPKGLTLRVRGYSANEFADLLLKFNSVGNTIGIDLLSARPSIHYVADHLKTAFSEEERLLLATLNHELDHARVHLSTSYGATLNSLHQAFFDCLLLRFDEGIDGLSNWLIDTNRVFEAKNSNYKYDECDPITFKLISLNHLSDVLSGKKCKESKEKLALSLAILKGYLNIPVNESLVYILPDQSFDQYINSEDRYQPYFNGEPLGSRCIIEGQAVFIQEYELEALDLAFAEISQFYPDGRIQELSPYHITQTIWASFFHEVIYQFDVLRVWEYMWSLELSLSIPIYPEMRGNQLIWHDIHPGWRFLKICKALKEYGYRFLPDEVSIEEVDSLGYEEIFKDYVCSIMNWPSQGEISYSWFNYLKENRIGLYSENNENGNFTHPRLRYMTNYFYKNFTGESYDLSIRNLCHFQVSTVICDDGVITLPTGCWGMHDTNTKNRFLRLKEYIIFNFSQYLGVNAPLDKFMINKVPAEAMVDFFSLSYSLRFGASEIKTSKIRELLFEVLNEII